MPSMMVRKHGLRLKMDLTGPNKMKLYKHLKDSAKVKKKEESRVSMSKLLFKLLTKAS